VPRVSPQPGHSKFKNRLKGQMVGPLSKKSAGNIQRMTGAIKMLTRSAILANSE